MENSPLEAAYTAARKADKATLNNDYAQAIEFHKAASTKFTEAITTTRSHEAKRTLDILAKQHLSRSKFLSEKRNLSPIPTKKDEPPPVGGGASSDLASSLASARGIDNNSTNMAVGNTKSTAGTTTNDDPYYKFYSSVNNTFTKAFNTAVKEETRKDRERSNSRINGSIYSATNESFYVVPNTTSLSPEELITENASLRTMINRTSIQLHAHETAQQRQKDALKTNLIQLKNELSNRETIQKRQLQAELDQLQQENEKLKVQNARLKTRWDELKQSAKKRREDDSAL